MIELVVVLVIVGLLAGIALVSYQQVVANARSSAVQTTAKAFDREYRALLAAQTGQTQSALVAAVTADVGGGTTVTGAGSYVQFTANGASACLTLPTSVTDPVTVVAGTCPIPAPAGWGVNTNYQLANGGTATANTPSAVDTGGVLAGKVVSKIATAAASVCAIADGTAYCWGNNAFAQLGVGDAVSPRTAPTPVVSTAYSGAPVTDITIAATGGCLISGGRVYCWGNNGSGQVGDGTLNSTATPVAVGGALTGKTATSIVQTGSSTCAIADSALYCWGDNTSGQLGDGTTTQRLTPVAVTNTYGGAVTSLATSPAANHFCAVGTDGNAYCWGVNTSGQLGDGTTTNRTSPTAVAVIGTANAKTVTAVAAGQLHSCAVATGVPYCWGNNTNGQLGDSTTTQRLSPVPVRTTGVLSGKTATRIAGGNGHTCVVASAGAYCWGSGSGGQLGQGVSAASNVPVAASGGLLAGKTVTQIAAGGNTTFAIWY